MTEGIFLGNIGAILPLEGIFMRAVTVVFCFFLGLGSALAGNAKVKYPFYKGVDCAIGGGHTTGWEDLGYHDEYCAHLVCEEAGICAPHGGAFVYDLPPLDYRGVRIVANTPGGSTALLRSDGGGISWGDREGFLEERSDIRHQLASGVLDIHASQKGFVVLKKGGSLLTWVFASNSIIPHGMDNITGDLASGVEQIFSGPGGFAALTKNDSVVAWRGDGSGGQGQKIALMKAGEVRSIVINEGAWAALRKDGSVVAWGEKDYGGVPGPVRYKLQNIERLYATRSAFAALKKDGSVLTWGNFSQGGDTRLIAHLLVDVVEIVSSNEAFAALGKNGSVITWGEGGKMFPIHSNVKKLVASRGGAFAALKLDDSVVTWGVDVYGGDMSSVEPGLEEGVANIFANYSGFAALKKDGSVISRGVYTDTDETFDRMAPYLIPRSEADPKRITTIASSPYSNAFFAIRRDGTFVSWGRGSYPYHTVFYDILDDPIWSKVYPDLEYVHYFSVPPKKRY